MRVFGPLGGDDAPEDDVGSFLHGELRTLDEVGEICVEKGEGGCAVRRSFRREASERRMVAQCAVKDLEHCQTVRIVRMSPEAGSDGRSEQFRLAGGEQRPDQGVQIICLLLKLERRSHGADLVSQTGGGVLARTAEQGVKPFLDPALLKGAREAAAPSPGEAHVLQVGACR